MDSPSNWIRSPPGSLQPARSPPKWMGFEPPRLRSPPRRRRRTPKRSRSRSRSRDRRSPSGSPSGSPPPEWMYYEAPPKRPPSLPPSPPSPPSLYADETLETLFGPAAGAPDAADAGECLSPIDDDVINPHVSQLPLTEDESLKLGIYEFLWDTRWVRVVKRIKAGANNSIDIVHAQNLPWATDNCQAATKDNMTLLAIRRSSDYSAGIMVLNELALTAHMGSIGIGPRMYGAKITFHPGNRRFAKNESIIQAFEMDLNNALDDPRLVISIAEPMLTGLISRLVDLDYICVDIKPRNVVLNMDTPGGSIDMRLIDFDVQFCGKEFLFDEEAYMDIVKESRDINMSVIEQMWTAKNNRTNTNDKKMKYAFMVLLMRMHILCTNPRSWLLLETMRDMYDPEEDRLNGVGLREYVYWLRRNIFSVRTMIVHYFYGESAYPDNMFKQHGNVFKGILELATRIL